MWVDCTMKRKEKRTERRLGAGVGGAEPPDGGLCPRGWRETSFRYSRLSWATLLLGKATLSTYSYSFALPWDGVWSGGSFFPSSFLSSSLYIFFSRLLSSARILLLLFVLVVLLLRLPLSVLLRTSRTCPSVAADIKNLHRNKISFRQDGPNTFCDDFFSQYK